MRVTAGVTACGQRRPLCITSSLRQATLGRRKDPDPQQPGSAKRTSECQDGYLTGAAKVSKGGPKRRQQQRWTEATSTAKVDRSDVNSKGGPKRRQQ
ncbi:hypothetical protein ElyMa_002584600 [Elysia marginata]|uniref:Uncharacterized protein n=1 Tax=Elysia marginata TaxID=1093978 RepID=A0AAV4H150_9GAST|nr:hypothetical protein ElyMa_002584600 [Elysia marginata]